MSTILDALKRLQRDRTQSSPQELATSVTFEPFIGRKRRASLGRWVALLALALAAGSSAYYLLLPRTGPHGSLVAEGGAATGPPPGTNAIAGARTPTSAIRAIPPAPARHPVAPPAVPSAPAALAPTDADDLETGGAPDETQVATLPADSLPEPIVRTPPPTPESMPPADLPVAESAPAEAPASTVPSQPAPAVPPSAPAKPVESTAPAGMPAARDAAEPPRETRVARATPPRDSPRARESKPKTSAPPAPPSAEIDRPTDAVGFPELSVEMIRWHPDPERREVELAFEGMSALQAREGDIVSGVSVHRIDPDAIEVRLGEWHKRIPLTQ